MFVIAVGMQPVFAQYELPEPAFHESAEVQAREVRSSPQEKQETFPLPVFDDVVHYLWDFSPIGLSLPEPLLPAVSIAAAASTDAEKEIPHTIRNNQYYLESLRLEKLAQDTYEYGDYDASAEFAAEAIRYANLSDEYVALQLKIKETNDAIAAAKQRLDWASSSGAAKQYPQEYGEAETYYAASLKSRSNEEWDPAIESANKVIEILAYVQAPDKSALPAQYTVRSWEEFRDCLWNIAGRPWAYGDPWKWQLLYNANKSKLPEPDNPNLILPGMVLDIPNAAGETRQGMYTD
jgi:hypothetical protein